MTALAGTLIHFIWQGAVVSLLLYGANTVLSRADSRSLAACGALAVMLVLFSGTYVVLARGATLPIAGSAPGAAAPGQWPAASSTFSGDAAPAIPRMSVETQRAVVLCWLAGVAVLSVRLAGGWAAAARLSRRGVAPPPEAWLARLDVLSARLEVARPVRLLSSLLAAVPSALGVLRPVILVPASAFTALAVPELEAILAHELAHVKRNDFLVNLLQSAAETLLFYHPAVWWVSHRIRVERENACDDLAVLASGDAALYARALVGLEQGRSALPHLAAASTGGSLLDRVRRLLTPQAVRADRLPPSIAAALALVAAGLLGAAAQATPPIDRRDASRLAASQIAVEAAPEPAAPDERQGAPPDSAPASPKAPGTRPKAARAPAPAEAATAAGTPKEAAPAAPRLSPSQLIAFRIHGVTPEFVEELGALGFRPVSADTLLALRIHGVTPEFIRAMRSEGLDASLERYTAFRIHGVTSDFVREVRALGYESVSADEFIAMRIHGVTPEYIRAMNKKVRSRLPIKELVEDRIFGIRGEER
jgi:beta-lactamase regulating signal transducer with metallopeptidase domain